MVGVLSEVDRGSSTRKRAPVSSGTGSISGDASAVQVGDPAGDGEPEAGAPARRCRGRVPKRSKTRSRSCGAIPGPWSATSSRDPPSTTPAQTRTTPTRRAVPRRVVEQVGQQLVQAGAVGVRRQVGRLDAYVERDAAAGSPPARTVPPPRRPRRAGATGRSARSSETTPASTRERSSRSSTRSLSRSAWPERDVDGVRVRRDDAVVEVLQDGDEGRRAVCAARGTRWPPGRAAACRRWRGRRTSC